MNTLAKEAGFQVKLVQTGFEFVKKQGDEDITVFLKCDEPLANFGDQGQEQEGQEGQEGQEAQEGQAQGEEGQAPANDNSTQAFIVTIKKSKDPNQKMEFECFADSQAINISSVAIMKGDQVIRQDLGQLDENGVAIFHDYLESKGVGNGFATILGLARPLWEDKNYKDWLDNLGAFLQ
eukprot:TRINITY_DN3831_c0_g1_i2.p2 TRINITY_DN3831_c0_g1~~TRINITY_DN3831_c0_g1_i2.p2  ORF type:complete len:179 (-),score=80.08 TRINITY_DN3831_c0_g1_i2:117-653(-)